MLIAPGVTMVGSDLALTAEGPVLLKGNVSWAIATACRDAAGFTFEQVRRLAAFAGGFAD